MIARDRRDEILRLERRGLLRSGLSLGALTLLTGCNLADGDAVDRVLWAMSRFNDRVQALLFDQNRLAPTYPASAITKPFPFNAFYSVDDAPDIDGDEWRLALGGLIGNKEPWTLAQLRGLPQESQITRHICVEGWSAIGQWSGVPFQRFLKIVDADTTAKYVKFECADRYYSTIDMPTALHPQTILALDYGNAPLPAKYGFPVKLRVPTKLGFKNPKHIVSIAVTNSLLVDGAPRRGYWEDQGYNWFSGS